MSAWREEVRAHIRLAFPVTVVQLGLMAMGAVDAAFLGRVSAVEFAAVAMGHTWTFTFIALGMGILVALDPLISQAWGARDEPAIARSLQRGLLLALLLSIPIGLVIWPAESALRLFQQEEAVVPIAGDYARITIAGVPAFLLFVVFRHTLQAMHRLRALLVVIVLTNLLNVFLDWVLVFGNLGFPALGAVGSAWGTAISRWCMALTIPLLAWPILRQYLSPVRRAALQFRPLWRLFLLGLPIGIQFMAEVGAFGAVALLVGTFDEESFAGHQVAITLASVSFMFPLGISMAAAVRVGNAIGREDAPGMRRAATVALVLGAGVMALFGLVFLLFPAPLARLITDIDEVLVIAVLLIPLAGAFQVFDGIQVVAVGVLRGTADTRSPMIIHFVGFWFFGLPIACYLAFVRDGGPQGLWWGLVVGLAAVAVIQIFRVRSRLSKTIVRTRIDDEEIPSAREAAD